MIRLFKWIVTLGLIGAVLTALWIGIGLWIGYYSVYSYPPSELHPEGASLIIDREEGEPLYNSPDYIKPPKQARDKNSGIGFGTTEFRRMKPVSIRTLFTFPYVEWAYRQSLNEAQLQKYEKGTLHKGPGKTGPPPR